MSKGILYLPALLPTSWEAEEPLGQPTESWQIKTDTILSHQVLGMGFYAMRNKQNSVFIEAVVFEDYVYELLKSYISD